MTTRLEAVAAVLLLFLVFVTIGSTSWFLRWRDRTRRVRRASRAQSAEREARGVLERAGFRVLGQQVRRNWSVFSDGDEVDFELVADYLVERRGQAWVAEVKTGERALDLRFGPTRRQLLEYREAFGVGGVLLVDAEANSVREIQFRATGGGKHARVLAFGVIGVAVGLALGLGLAWLV